MIAVVGFPITAPAPAPFNHITTLSNLPSTYYFRDNTLTWWIYQSSHIVPIRNNNATYPCLLFLHTTAFRNPVNLLKYPEWILEYGTPERKHYLNLPGHS